MNIQAALQSGLAALQRADFAGAEAQFSSVLKTNPTNADALQLMGMVRKAQNRLPEAERFLRQSLTAQPRQPHVLNNLGNLIVATRRDDAAILYERAIALSPRYPDAIANLAGIAFERGELMVAKQQFLVAIALDANHVQSLLGLTALTKEQGLLAEAKSWAARAVLVVPNSLRAHSLTGDIASAANDFETAIMSYKKALNIGPASDALWAALGGALRYALRDQEAFEAFSTALELNPANIAAHRNFNALLWNYGRTDQYLDSYRATLPLVPNDEVVRIAFAEDLLRIGKVDEAQLLVDEITAIDPLTVGLSQIKGRIEFASGNFDAARVFFEHAIDEANSDCQTRVYQIDSLLKAHRFDDAADSAQATLALFPDDQDTLARLMAANRLSGAADVFGLWNYDQFVKAIDLQPPAGRNIADFNAELGDHLRTLHRTTNHPIDQTLRGGTQTFGNLFALDKSAIVKSLVTMLEEAIAGYIADLPIWPDHPVSRRRGAGFKFDGSWSARLAANGFHTNHIHPKGWLSSAYYVALPDQIKDQDRKAGWFKLGQTNMNLGEKDFAQKLIEPKVGRLILFPSYYWHGTTPFSDEAERLTIADRKSVV